MKTFIIIIISSIILSQKVFARVYTVQKNSAVSSIQQAINIATNGDTIMVTPGIYTEKNIQVNKSLVLIGKNYPVLDGQHTYEIISIKADNVILDGFKLIHSGISSLIDIAGIKIYARKNVVIKNNILDDTFFGIYLQKAVNCLILY